MISKKFLLSLIVSAAALLMTASTAFATTPEPELDCSTGRNKRGYDAGVLVGGSIVRQAWNGIGQDVSRVDEFVTKVRAAVRTAIRNLPDDATDYVLCRAKGLAQGTCDELGEIQDEVGAVCFLDGQVWGDLSADLYCALSIEFEGQDVLGLLPVTPDSLCGENFVEGCQSQFEISSLAYAGCPLYVAAPWDDVFADWQVGVCIY
jgi:hypothetical protein